MKTYFYIKVDGKRRRINMPTWNKDEGQKMWAEFLKDTERS